MTVPIAGPHPVPRKPTIPLPPGACDCHAHIFGPAGRFPYTEGRGYTPPDAPVEKYLALLDALGFTYGVVVQGNAHGFDNRAILDAVRSTPARLRGVAITDTSVGPLELRQWHEWGIRALRFHVYFGDNKPKYLRGVGWDVFSVFRPMMLELGWHIQIWIDWRALPENEEMIRRQPMPVMIDHMLNIPAERGKNDPSFQSLVRLLGDGKCWVKLSGAYRLSKRFPDYPDARPFHEALVAANPDQLVWGTDWPHPQVDAAIMPNDGVLVDLFNTWTPETLRRRILVENPARLYGFPQVQEKT